VSPGTAELGAGAGVESDLSLIGRYSRVQFKVLEKRAKPQAVGTSNDIQIASGLASVAKPRPVTEIE
jgi:hypothetical protein